MGLGKWLFGKPLSEKDEKLQMHPVNFSILAIMAILLIIVILVVGTGVIKGLWNLLAGLGGGIPIPLAILGIIALIFVLRTPHKRKDYY